MHCTFRICFIKVADTSLSGILCFVGIRILHVALSAVTINC